MRRKELLKEMVAGFLLGAGLMASFLFFGLRAKAASIRDGVHSPVYTALQTIDRQELSEMRGAEPWTEPLPISQDELDLLAAIVYAEAGDQGYYGMQLVCDVILNRIDHGFGNSISEVVYSPGQFSPVTDGGLDRAWGRVTQECYDACIEELTGPRINYDIIYFSMYGCANGQFVFQYLDHYFGI